MHNIKWIRENPEAFDEAMKRRGFAPQSTKILELDKEKRAASGDLQELQAQANAMAKEIGALMAQGKKEEAQKVIEASKAIKEQIAAAKDGEGDEGENNAVTAILETLPNMLADEVPDGADESANQEVRQWGDVPSFDFTPKDHVELGEALNGLDFEQTAKISGARFATISGDLALLERALGDFMLDVHTQEFGYREVCPPVLVRDDAMYGTSQLPKFAEDSFQTTNGFWLIPTAEVSLTNLVREQIIPEAELPIRFTARTPCFRSEAGSAGKDTRGMIRQHQFNKVELVSITTPEAADEEHERLTGAAETILQRLKLPYRVMLLCSGDTGFGSRKTYDLEVWLPGQGKYREISSCSQFGEFQARRMQARFRPQGGKETRFVHTLNGSALAVGRTLIAVMENYQQADGSIRVPDVLKPYMHGKEVIQIP